VKWHTCTVYTARVVDCTRGHLRTQKH